MLEITDQAKCSGCHACASACPKQCIHMTADAEGFLYPEIDRSQCVDCHLCEKVCPILNQKTASPDALQDAYAAYCTDETIRMKSSSGGVFTLLAGQILSQGGVVFGAALAEDCRSVSHIAVERAEELCRLQGSKYVQSMIGTAYQDARNFLDAGRTVLFTGTPCQIGGLYAYLKQDYPNLLTQDIVCHGVPSPKVWDRYVTLREQKAGSGASDVFFRSKTTGWKTYSMAMSFQDGKRYTSVNREDPYMKGFLADLYLRPSCYECAFKTKQRQSDITLADFWGIQNVLPALDDNKGTSVVWVHSGRGKALFQQIAPQLRYEQIDIAKALVYNTAAVTSTRKPPERPRFWNAFQDAFPAETVEKLSKRTIWKRAKRYLARMKRKLFS